MMVIFAGPRNVFVESTWRLLECGRPSEPWVPAHCTKPPAACPAAGGAAGAAA